MSTDLFGAPVPEPQISPRTGKEKSRNLVCKGYAARPGSGPEGETCKTCDHSVRTEGGNSHFYKCAKVRHRWTHGPGSDIRISSPACSLWEKRVPMETPLAGYRWIKCGEKFPLGYRFVNNGVPCDPAIAGDQLIGKRASKNCETCFLVPV